MRELSLGALIGRRPQLREATSVLRRTDRARAEHGSIAGVLLTGIGGIGKTAVAGRVITRLRGDGWRVAVHEGRWNPAALFAAVADATADARTAAALASDGVDGVAKVVLVGRLLASERLLLVFDDVEQNLTPSGTGFDDPAFADVLSGWCDAAEPGAVLLTSRFPLPDDDRLLVRVLMPPLSDAELRRLFLRLPALQAMPARDRQLLARMIGGHPRLIEYVDAPARGRPAQLRDVHLRLRTLATAEGVDLRRPRALGAAIDDALLLGCADVLLGPLTDHERVVLDQLAVSRAPMTVADLAFALDPEASDLPALHAEVERLPDLTLLASGPEVLMHPWTAEILGRRSIADTAPRHERALAMRMRRIGDGRATYPDLVEVPRHLVALGRAEEVPSITDRVVTMLAGALAAGAYLAEVRRLLPAGDASWVLVAKQEYEAIRSGGNLDAAASVLEAVHRLVASRVAGDPDDEQWAGYLSVVLVDLGDLAVQRGDLPAARGWFEAASPSAEEWTHRRPRPLVGNGTGPDRQPARGPRRRRGRLTDLDPTNAVWRNDLAGVRARLADLDDTGEEPGP